MLKFHCHDVLQDLCILSILLFHGIDRGNTYIIVFLLSSCHFMPVLFAFITHIGTAFNFLGEGSVYIFWGGEGINFPTETDFFHTNKKSVCLFFDTKYQYNHFRFGGLWCLTILSTIFQLYRAWLSVLLMQKTKVPEKNHRPVASR